MTKNKEIPTITHYPHFKKGFWFSLNLQKKEEIDVKLNIGKLKIDTKHLLYWNGQSDPVMIARYYFNHGCFYYNWVDEIKINTAVEQQTICLPYKIDNIQNNLDNTVYQEVVKENILEKLIPPEVIDLVYVPNSPTTGIGYVTIDKIRNGQQIHKLLKSELLNQLIEEVTIKSEIQKIKSQLLVESENVTNRFRLALLYVKVGKMEEALSELNLLIYNFKMIEAKIIFSLITNREISILENLGNYNFGYYFKMGDEFPDNAEVEMTIDGELFKIGAYNKQGIIFPKQRFLKIDKISWKSAMDYKGSLGNGSLFSSRIITSTKLKIYRGLIGKQKDIVDKYSELILEDELSISGLNIS